MTQTHIIYVATMGMQPKSFDQSLKEFILKHKDIENPKYLVIFYGADEQKKPYKNAVEIKQVFGSDFDHVDLFEIPNPQDVKSCIDTMKSKIDFLLKEHEINNVSLYINPTGGTAAMSFAAAFSTIWLIPYVSDYILDYQGGKRGEDGDVRSDEDVEIISVEMRNDGILMLAANDLLKRRFDAAANYLFLLNEKKLNDIEKNIYYGALSIYEFSIFNFKNAGDLLQKYSRYYISSSQVKAGNLLQAIKFIEESMHLLRSPIEAGVELERYFQRLKSNSPDFSEDLREIDKQISQRWSDFRRLIFGLIAISKNKLLNGRYPDTVMLSYRIAELYVQLELLKYGISVWNLKKSVEFAKEKIANKVLSAMNCNSKEEIPNQIGFNKSLEILLSLKKLDKKIEASEELYFNEKIFEVARNLQNNRNYCFLAHGFDYKDKHSAEKAIIDLMEFLSFLRVSKDKEDLRNEVERFNLLF